MKHITKSHIKKAMREHHMIGQMLGDKSLEHIRSMDKKTHKKALEEHHFLGSLIGMLSKGLGMAAPYLAKGLSLGTKAASLGAKGLGAVGGTLARNAGNIGHAVNAAGTAAQAGMALNQMRQANRAAAAQERMMNAQAQGAEDQNSYLKRQMEAGQAQKTGGQINFRRNNPLLTRDRYVKKIGQTVNAEDQNAYLKRKMEAEQVQKRGGRTKSHRRH